MTSEMPNSFHPEDVKYQCCCGIHIKTASYIVGSFTVVWALSHLFYSGFATSVIILCALEGVALGCLTAGLILNKRRLLWPYMLMQSVSVKFIIVRLVLFFFNIDHSHSMDKDVRAAYYLKVIFVCLFYICSTAFAFYSLYIVKRCHRYLHDMEDADAGHKNINMN